jgi:CRP-like cAMP-binding protein
MIDFLKQQRLSEAQITELMSASVTFSVKKRTILLNKGDICQHIYFVESGILRAGVHDEDLKDWTQCFYSFEGLKWAGLSANCLLQKPSDYFIEVLEDAEITAFPVAFFQKLRRSNTVWSQFFQCQLMVFLRYLEQKSINNISFSPLKRYLAFIDTHPQIVKTIPQHYIASYIGVAPESLSRIRKRLN